MKYEEHLMEAAPLLYSESCWLDCEEGWYEIISNLSIKLESIIKKGLSEGKWDDDEYPCCAYITKRDGKLRFIMSKATREMEELIYKAEKESLITCEKCGNLGTRRTYRKEPYSVVRCERCETLCFP